MATHFCSNCGEPAAGSGSKICVSCGRPLQMDQTESFSNENYQNRTHYETPKAQSGAANQSLVLAAALSFFLPGLGQVYNGKIGRGILLNVCYWVGFCLLIPGLIVWVYAMWDAYKEAEKINRGEVPFKNPRFWEIAAFFAVYLFFIISFIMAYFVIIMLAMIGMSL